MPDRVGEVLRKIWEDIQDERNGSETLAEAKSELLKVVCESLPEKKFDDITLAEKHRCEGYNKAIDDVIEAMERLFGKEIA